MSFRILALDGGGTWSLIQILTLADLYRSGGALLSGHQVLRDFDLVVANSGGSLVLGGLLKDLPLGEIARFFEDPAMRRGIFAAEASAGRLASWLGRKAPRGDGAKRLETLRDLLNSDAGEPGLGDITLEALRARTRLSTQFMIAAFDYDRKGAVFFRSHLKSRAASFGTPAIATLAEAIHASTTAPFGRFDGPAAVSRGRRCWDGALAFQHNPVLAGIAEALANGVPREAIQVLSIGSGSVDLPLAGGNEDNATAKLMAPRRHSSDAERVAEALIDDPVDGASFLAHLMLGQDVPEEAGKPVGESALVRLNPVLQPIRTAGGWVRPAGLIEGHEASDEFLRLARMPGDTVEETDLALLRKFCLLWHNDAVANQPIRANADTFDCEIGQRWYSEARAHWLNLQQTRQALAAAPAPTGHSVAPAPSAPPRSAPPPRLTTPKIT